MFENQAARRKFARRGRSAGAAASVGAALIAVGIGAFPAAGADTSSASRSATAPAAAPAERSLGSAGLMQSDDFFQQGLGPVRATVDLTGKQALSACSGEETMRELTKGKAAAYVCENFTCQLPTSDPAKLKALLSK